MKRSEINALMREADAFIRSFGFVLPPFAYWSPAQLRRRVAADSACIRNRMLGWDITDYGQGRFAELGLLLFTLRNGRREDLPRGRGMLYAEKIMISRPGQLCPMHRHRLKTEDIINRGGGTLVVELFRAAGEEGIDETSPVQVLRDGSLCRLPAGGRLRLAPGESVTLGPDIWHAFRAEGSAVLIGEVSTVNDDRTDNLFRDPVGRFAQIEEDEPPLHLLVADYPRWLEAESGG